MTETKGVCLHMLACWARPYGELDNTILCADCLGVHIMIELQDTDTPSADIADRVKFDCNHSEHCHRCYIAVAALMTGVNVDLHFQGKGKLAERVAALLRRWKGCYGSINVDNSYRNRPEWKR